MLLPEPMAIQGTIRLKINGVQQHQLTRVSCTIIISL